MENSLETWENEIEKEFYENLLIRQQKRKESAWDYAFPIL